jgi:D-glycero-D-manno-heptose 1,7-bisphosphate phosphatase
MPRPALFLDRDGTIVEHIDLLTRVDQLRLLPGAADAIARARADGFALIVVTNQPVIAHGLADEATVRTIHDALSDMLGARGARVDAYYVCPHHPGGAVERYTIACECRKPRSGMLRQAALDFDLDLNASVMVGDRLTDVAAGSGAGCRTVLLAPASEVPAAVPGAPPGAAPDFVCAGLPEAVSWAGRSP